MHTDRQKGFTLVEVTLSLAIIATGLIAIISLIPTGQQAARQSADHTVTAIILEDVHERLEGVVLQEGDVTFADTKGTTYDFLAYDQQGVFIPPDSPSEDLTRRLFRAEAEIVKIQDRDRIENTGGMMGVVVELYWPIAGETGEVLGDPEPKTTISYYLTPLAGPEWAEIDPSYEPKIEF